METVPESGTGSASSTRDGSRGLILNILLLRLLPPLTTDSPRRSFYLFLTAADGAHCTDVEMRVRLVDADYERIRKLRCPRANTKSRRTRSFNPAQGRCISFFSGGKALVGRLPAAKPRKFRSCLAWRVQHLDQLDIREIPAKYVLVREFRCATKAGSEWGVRPVLKAARLFLPCPIRSNRVG